MERFAIASLYKWKKSKNRKPLIIQGARQTGKKWLVKEFRRREYEQVACINFESSDSLKSIFRENSDVTRLITAFQIGTGIRIRPESTLLILDEIQEAEKGITSLKYFCENAPAEIVPRIKMLRQSFPSQLSRENKKFIYGVVEQGGRAKEFELALAWLTDCGLVHKIQRISKPAIPLVVYQATSAFKLFIPDVGLLSAMGGLARQTILQGNSIFSEFKGAMAEQFVLQHFKTRLDESVFYWSSDTSQAELDFVIQNNDQVIPSEVKAEKNLKVKSLKSFYEKFNPKFAVRTSMSYYRDDGWLVNVPLYALESYSWSKT